MQTINELLAESKIVMPPQVVINYISEFPAMKVKFNRGTSKAKGKLRDMIEIYSPNSPIRVSTAKKSHYSIFNSQPQLT
jgi:hypothetical protein